MATTETISQDLYDFLVTKNFDPEPMDAKGNDTNAEDAKVFSFDYVSSTGKNYGTGVIVIADPEDVKFFYGDNLGRSMEEPDKSEWFKFLEELSDFSTQHRHNWTPSDISKLKYTMAGIAAIKEGLFEGYYGTRRVSYMGEQTQARLVIKHNRVLGENDKRYRYVESLYIETGEGERFKLPFKNMTGGRAMLEHVRQGGRPYDVRGNHIAQLVTEAATLSRFNRASQNKILEGATQELVTEAAKYYQQIRETLQHLGSGRGYAKYFESWSPVDITPQEGLVEDIKTLFIEQTLDTRIEQALPILARLQQQGNDMKEAQIFESWIDQLAEGTWSLPETPEQQAKLHDLMSKPLSAGPKGSYATEELYGLVGDDELFDIIGEIAEKNPDANIWEDDGVQRRLEELGVYMVNQETPEAPTAPETGMTEGRPEDLPGIDYPRPGEGSHKAPKSDEHNPYPFSREEDDDYFRDIFRKKREAAKQQGVAEGDNLATFEDINAICKAAGLPIVEHSMLDESGNTWDHLLNRFRHEVEQFRAGHELERNLYDALFDYYREHGAMPYEVAKGVTADPHNWVSHRLAQDLGLDENLIAAQAMPVTTESASCNMTAEGEYCPEHGLEECGMGMPTGIMDETLDKPPHDDAINYNAAITGSYYESREGDAVLARIKSLALLK